MNYEIDRPRNPEPPKKPARKTKLVNGNQKTEMDISKLNMDMDISSSKIKMYPPVFGKPLHPETVCFQNLETETAKFSILDNLEINQFEMHEFDNNTTPVSKTPDLVWKPQTKVQINPEKSEYDPSISSREDETRSLLGQYQPGIYVYKVIFDCLFECPIISQQPLVRFASNFDWGTRENHGNVLSLVS